MLFSHAEMNETHILLSPQLHSQSHKLTQISEFIKWYTFKLSIHISGTLLQKSYIYINTLCTLTHP